MMKLKNSSCLAALAILSAIPLPATRADVRLPDLLSDHMVLQRNAPIRIWGWADPGEPVTVAFGGKQAKTTASPNGKWEVKLPPLPVNATPQTLTITGKNTITLSDILVGDVWVCSGQSNMGFYLSGASTAARDIPLAGDPQLRLFHLQEKTAPTPQDNVPLWNRKQWLPATPEEVGPYTAVGYYFGRELRKALGIPIGLISSTQGGSVAQLWTSLDAIEKNVNADPEFKEWVAKTRKMIADYPGRAKGYPEARAAYEAAVKKWHEEVELSPEFVAKVSDWEAAKKQALADGKAPPPRPQPATPRPVAPEGPDYGPHNTFTVGTLYNAMIAPLTPYTIKGVTWYQGESNDSNSKQYGVLFPLMIQDWRKKWGLGDIPFLFVQLPNIEKPAEVPFPPTDRWPGLREAQTRTLALPNTGMAVTIDVGDPYNVHGADKIDPGTRLALVALRQVYSKDISAHGPVFDSMKVAGNKAIISFKKNTANGLKIGSPPWTPSGKIPPVAGEVKGFIIAGADQKWAWAQAKIVGNTVEVSSPDVPKPVAVRYGWANNPPCNLYNSANLPAAPFRTDDWAIVSKK